MKRTIRAVIMGITLALLMAPVAGFARDRWGSVGELEDVQAGANEVLIDGKVFAMDSATRITGPTGESISASALEHYEAHEVSYVARKGEPDPVLLRLAVQDRNED